MGLFERLKAAEAGREATVDLVAEEQQTRARTGPVWGKPSRCPACDQPGYLDHIDLVRRVMYQHCPDCFHRWEIAESETVSGG